MHPKTKLCSAVTLSVFVIANANAHIVLQKKSAPRASQYTAAFEVGHGCAGQATTELIVTLPAGVRLDNERISNERVSKTGWQLDTTKTGQVRWHSGLTAPTATDEFLVDVVLPDATGPLYWPAKQICGAVVIDWKELPTATEPSLKLNHPAAKLDVTEK